jgi:glycosyltransferase involved in cell wall biosynthesis
VPRAAFSIADSGFNARDLEDAGYSDPAVVPILLDFTHFTDTPDPDVMARINAEQAHGGSDLLFVGRLAPNKCQHDLVKVLATLRASVDPMARLRLVGGAELVTYESALRELAAGLGPAGAVEITGSVSPGALAAYYATADVFVSVSEHEGFCVPLLEAMAHDVPVVAYGAGAVPETLGAGGVLLPDKAPALVAAAVARVARDRGLRDTLVSAGRAQLATFAPEIVSARLREVLRSHGVVGSA